MSNVSALLDFEEDILLHDIALLRLERSLHFGVHVAPVCLPDPKDPAFEVKTGHRCIAAGWGKLVSERTSTSTLSYTYLW